MTFAESSQNILQTLVDYADILNNSKKNRKTRKLNLLRRDQYLDAAFNMLEIMDPADDLYDEMLFGADLQRSQYAM